MEILEEALLKNNLRDPISKILTKKFLSLNYKVNKNKIAKSFTSKIRLIPLVNKKNQLISYELIKDPSLAK